MNPLAVICKVLAAIIWFVAALVGIVLILAEMQSGTPLRDAPRDLGTPLYYLRMCLAIVMYSAVALLAVAPNRWFIFSRMAFFISLSIALMPFCVVLYVNFSDPFMSVGQLLENSLQSGIWLFMALFFGPLPLSLILSYRRQQKGVKVTYV